MPMAAMTSALRRLASARVLRAAPCRAAALMGLRVNTSVQSGERDEQERADHRRQPNQRMEEEADCEIERHPGQIEEAERPAPGQKAPDLVEIAQGQRAHGPARPQGQARDKGEHARAQLLIKGACHAQQNATPEKVEGGLPSVKSPGQKGERDEGGNAPARDDPVIDLDLVQRG